MVYVEELSVRELMDARSEASAMLKEGGKRKALTMDEALVFQAASHVLLTVPTFYGYQISNMTEIRAGTVYPILQRMSVVYGLFESKLEDRAKASKRSGAARRVYTPTEKGEQVLAVFQRNAQRRQP